MEKRDYLDSLAGREQEDLLDSVENLAPQVKMELAGNLALQVALANQVGMDHLAGKERGVNLVLQEKGDYQVKLDDRVRQEREDGQANLELEVHLENQVHLDLLGKMGHQVKLASLDLQDLEGLQEIAANQVNGGQMVKKDFLVSLVFLDNLVSLAELGSKGPQDQ